MVNIVEGAAAYRGTGVLIGAEWVLTAAHNWDAGALTGLSFTIGGATYAAQAWWQHPGWVSAPGVGLGQGRDVALFRLVEAVAGVTPARLHTAGAELGREVVVVGAGLAGTVATGAQANPAGTLYGITNTVDRVLSFGAGGGLLVMDFDAGSGVFNTLTGETVYDEFGAARAAVEGAALFGTGSAEAGPMLEGTTAAGDSGGPMFADFGAGWELVGLTSRGVSPAAPGNLYGGGYGDVAYFTRVAGVTDWIYAVVPEPAAFAWITGAGALAAAGGGRRRREVTR